MSREKRNMYDDLAAKAAIFWLVALGAVGFAVGAFVYAFIALLRWLL